MALIQGNGMGDKPSWKSGAECVAKFNFEGISQDDLPFKKNDVLTILSASRDPNWYKARRPDGKEGMVPATYLAARSEVTLTTMPWFHGKIKREDSEVLLHPRGDGLFLVRESTNFPGDYTLSVCFEGKVEHYRILYRENKVTIDEEEFFDNLVQLIEHYQKDADGLCTRLRKPLDKQGGVAVVVDIKQFEKSGWAIKRQDLSIGASIGKGEFGDVHSGMYKGQKVAIKTLKDDQAAIQSFLQEASLMTRLRHPNLVQLLGVSLDQKPTYIVTEFMARGSLVDYLRTRGRAVISRNDLLKFARDICDGMTYLESKEVVHRDLAARNVLIAEDNTAKVSDFGLAHDTKYSHDGGRFPIKWTSPEALRRNEFTSKSDVWSYGILLWELYSYGRVPYPRVRLDDVVQTVERGYRMDAPDGCPEEIYSVMRKCWQFEPKDRPPFEKIKEELRGISFV
ncbi:tyrosine-protein kinase CSK-like [Oscarella lobularis]|uniref:tyrosine-protein kinase CSK-like n=1 Tax=Oscarella lobularis TaxID=121494 RepID=UPI0033135B77